MFLYNLHRISWMQLIHAITFFSISTSKSSSISKAQRTQKIEREVKVKKAKIEHGDGRSYILRTLSTVLNKYSIWIFMYL